MLTIRMARVSTRKIIVRITQPQYADLRTLTAERSLDSALVEALVQEAVDDRLELARGLLDVARLLAAADSGIIRRSAVSRAYFAAYHATRAAVFAVKRRDEHDHGKLPTVADDALRPLVLGETLRELRKRRNEADYSPYPGPDEWEQYEPAELDDLTRRSLEMAETLVQTVQEFVEHGR